MTLPINILELDGKALNDLPLTNDLRDPFGDYVVELIKKKLYDISSDDSLGNNESEDSSLFFGNENEEESSDIEQDQPMESKLNDEESEENQEHKEENVESPTQPEFTKVPLTHSQAPISEWFYDTSLQILVTRRINETEKGNELLKKIRQTVWYVEGREEVALVSSYIPIISWGYLHDTGTYEILRADGSKERFNTSKLLCLDEISLQNLGKLPLINKEKNEMTFGVERAIKAFTKRYSGFW
ncbi:hypothetical protein L1987_08087 [Smallanthus sonchifolius]|uniref:Uncharacterized protein n=1 Tax=Smallanthus sonchifolius TaxID=185202 RepID=A0ACB9JJ88_9ASTR|nr:hypothetical protein L1987_08087 [Smallanthus sonchifolius]